MKASLCKVSDCFNNGKYARYCGHFPEQKLPAAPVIDKNSDKRKAELKEYHKWVSVAIKERPKCEMKTPACTGKTQGFHHPAGRQGDKLNDIEELKASCNACNLWVEVNDQLARQMGLKKSRHTKKEQA